MYYRICADMIMVIHFLFILFVLFGSLLTLYKKWLVWIHIPVVLWGIGVEIVGWICPLTPLENRCRGAAGQEGYAGGFIEHYLLSIMYPDGLTGSVQLMLGGIVLIMNLFLYGVILLRKSRKTGIITH